MTQYNVRSSALGVVLPKTLKSLGRARELVRGGGGEKEGLLREKAIRVNLSMCVFAESL